MAEVEIKSKRYAPAGDRDAVRCPVTRTRCPRRRLGHAPAPRDATSRPPVWIAPILINLVTITLAAALGWAMWDAYMGAPWTRDATVRAYGVTMAPEVAGRIVQLPAVDNQFVHKGDLLMVIDPTDYRIAVRLPEAAVEQAEATAQNAAREAKRRQDVGNAVSVKDRQISETNAIAAQAQYGQAQADLEQARVNLERT